MPYFTPEDIFKLSPQERVALIGDLWDSLDGHDVPIPNVQMAELQARAAHLTEDKEKLVGWDALKATIDARRTDA